MKVKTYSVNTFDAWLQTEGDDTTGSYVKYEDYAALAAECAALKSAIEFAEPWLPTCDEELLHRIEIAKQTPATDRIYAGIKADGVEWIEGNEPAEFGRYWVRYETDVGPQYCSAKWIEHNFCASSDTNIHKIWLADHSRSISSLKGVTHYTKLPASLEGGAL
ncbi:hypothetical protein ACRCNB_00695 [Klebsiella michiganensis]|uniref:hypothetical protein n=1 Tax=Klebsiella michiganensis TaxID=1134687 RepID=UPI003D96EA36